MKLTLATLFTLLAISCADNTWGDDFEGRNEDLRANPNPDNKHFKKWLDDQVDAGLAEPRRSPSTDRDEERHHHDWSHRRHYERRHHDHPHHDRDSVDFRQERSDQDIMPQREHGEWSRKPHRDLSQRPHGDWSDMRYHDRPHGDWSDRYHGDRYKEKRSYERKYDQEYRDNRKPEGWKARHVANEIPLNPTRKYTADPPDHTKLIPMARYVLRNADWTSIATISAQKSIEGFPFTNVKSIVEGSSTNSTGIPYFYMSPLDFTAKDLTKNSRATVLASLEETQYCKNQNWDAEDPRCTRLMLSGKMKLVKEGTPEYIFAKAALFERHPAMANFPPDHNWFVAKLKIAQIAMVDWFGGAKYIPVRDYLAYNYTDTEKR